MLAEQISIFLENKAGRLAEVTKTLSNAGISIRALSLADTSDFGILRIIVAEYEKAKVVLKENGFTIGSTSVVAVEVEDKPGGLHNILELFAKYSINVEYMYAYVQRDTPNATMIFRFDNADKALEILEEHKIPVVSGDRLYS